MNLSVWSSYYRHLSPEKAMEEFKKYGYDYCELSDEHAAELLERGDPKTVGREFGEFCRNIGMSIPQGHLYLRVRLCSETEDAVEILKNWLDMFYEIGIKRAVLHCDALHEYDITPEEKREKNAFVLKQLTDHLNGKDLVICLENLIRCNKTADEILWYINKIGSANLGICLDTGHLNITDKDQVKFIKTAGKHLKALHIADNEGERDQHMMPFGRGNVDFIAVARALKEIGYDGLFNLEIPGDTYNCPHELRGRKLEFIRNIYDYLNTQI